MRIGIVVNDIATEGPRFTTTSLAMTATNRGHEVWYMGVADLACNGEDRSRARARLAPVRRHRSGQAYLTELRGRDAQSENIVVDDLDLLLLRNDPADDVVDRPWAGTAGINFGRLAVRRGVIVLNDPDGLARAGSKMYLQYFPREVRPRTFVSCDRNDIKAFIDDCGGSAVIKPLSGSKGRNVFLVRPEDRPNLNQMIEAVHREGYVMAQEYLPDAVAGDTRFFLMNGRPLIHKGKYAAVRRRRDAVDGDIRSNIAAGGEAERARIDENILRLAELVRPRLIEDGMFLVGLDIVGDKIMEINVFSPGALWHASRIEGVDFFLPVVEALERKVAYGDRCENVKMATL